MTSLFETTKGIEVEASIVIDESVESLEIATYFAKEHPVVISYSPTRRGAVNCWNIGLRQARANLYVHQGDDLTYQDGWLDIALKSHQDHLQGFGLLGLNDSMHNGNEMATHFLYDLRFVKEIMGGVMAPPLVRYYGIDSISNELAKQAGRFYWESSAIVRHIHPANSGRLLDETDMSHQDFWTEDQNAMDAWRGRGRKVEWGAVI